FNPRSPCGERPAQLGNAPVVTLNISIHAPRVGSDLPHQGADPGPEISIHAPRVGSDSGREDRVPLRENFNPRSPCGERPFTVWFRPRRGRFQSTLPVWGATKILLSTVTSGPISIHAPRVG